MATKTLKIGDKYEGTAVDGHRRVYTVRGFYPDGMAKTSGWDAPHADNCPCSDSESWY